MDLFECRVLVLLVCLSVLHSVLAIGQDSCVSFTPSQSSFTVATGRSVASIYLSDDEWPGVQRAAADFASDVWKVTNSTPQLYNSTSQLDPTPQSPPIIIGTLGKSSLIDAVVNYTRMDVSAISGSWESFMTKVVNNPLPGISSAYVIIGADKRGTIFAMYDLSEQMGVSPWYWYVDRI